VIDRIRLDPSPSPWPDRFPHRHGGIVRVRCRDGRVLSHHCRAPLGSGPTGIEWDDVDAKYRALMPRCGLSPDKIEHSLTLIHQLGDSEHISPLLESLRLDGLGEQRSLTAPLSAI
jgi:2-methylcitrate dehydratase PrpD